MPEEDDTEVRLFRERVRDAIQEGGKVGEMSRKTGIPVGTLNKYVSLRSVPSAINALKIAKAVGLTLEDLARGRKPGISGQTTQGFAEVQGDLRIEQSSHGHADAREEVLDSVLLVQVIQELEIWIKEKGADVPPNIKADLIKKIYDYVLEETARSSAETRPRDIRKLLKLVV